MKKLFIDIYKYIDIINDMNQSNDVVEVLKALADETRLSIVRNLAQRRAPVATCDLVRSCASFHRLSQPTMSHHVSKLVDAGVLVEQKTGTAKSYSVDTDKLERHGIDVEKL